MQNKTVKNAKIEEEQEEIDFELSQLSFKDFKKKSRKYIKRSKSVEFDLSRNSQQNIKNVEQGK